MAENTESSKPYADPAHPLNESKYHTGKPCIEDPCTEPAGTHWSPYWCKKHNAERLDRVEASLTRMVDKLASKKEDR